MTISLPIVYYSYLASFQCCLVFYTQLLYYAYLVFINSLYMLLSQCCLLCLHTYAIVGSAYLHIRYRSNVTSYSLTIFPWVKWLLDRVTSGSSGKLRKHSTWYANVVESRRTTCLLDTRIRKTGSVEDSSCTIRGPRNLVSCFQIFYAQALINKII